MENDEKRKGSVPGGPTPTSVSAGDVAGVNQTGTVSGGACISYMAADAKLQDPIILTDVACNRLRKTLSSARMAWYLKEAQGDLRLALRLHSWNAAVAASLLPTLHLTEVAVRNFAVSRLISRYGKAWYSNDDFDRILGKARRAEELRDAVLKEKVSKRTGNLTNYITSELTFGFWVSLYTKTFVPELWTAALHTINPSVPRSVGIAQLHSGIDFVRTFRNNVTHHKNIVRTPVEENFERVLEVLGWVCRDSAALARGTTGFPGVWAARPVEGASEA